MHEVTIKVLQVICSCGWETTTPTQRLARRLGYVHAGGNTPSKIINELNGKVGEVHW